jgi:hypothetical protein
MTLCSDNALGKLKLCTGVRVNKLARATAGNVTGLTNGSGNADRTSVCKRNLNLACGSCGTENGCLKRALRAYNGKLLCTSVLTGLAKLLLHSELIALSEEYVNRFAAKMNVSCGGFNDNLFHFRNSPSLFILG